MGQGPVAGRGWAGGATPDTRVVGNRLVQALIDTGLVFVSLFIAASAAQWGLLILVPITWLVVNVITPVVIGGRTPGMWVVGIGVVRNDGVVPGVGRILGRTLLVGLEYVLGGLLGAVFIGVPIQATTDDQRVASLGVVAVSILLPLVAILGTSERTRLADLAAATLVVRMPRTVRRQV